MNRSIRTLQSGIEDWGGVTSPQFKSFATKFKNDLQKELNTVGAKITAFSKGHYDVSGFFRMPNNNCYYFSLSDVRHGAVKNMMFRRAEHEKDYTGGSNQWVALEEDMVERMRLK